MTDKEQIIIDGANILDCDNYYVEQETDQVKCDLSGEYCRENKNCLFKQLARKTQLSIEQSKELIRLRQELKESTVKNKNLRQECEELKAQLNDIKKEYDEYVLTHKYSNEEFQQERKAVADLAFWSNRYKRGLEEIKKELKEDLYCESQECGCDDFEECLKRTKEYILDIINKAKGEGNE